LDSQLDIIFTVATSDSFVLSNPGVSTRKNSELPNAGKGNLKVDISVVWDSRLFPTIPWMPVAISMNFGAYQKKHNKRG